MYKRQNLNLDTKYVSSYLSYWRKKGLVYQEAGRWHLSRVGEDLAKEILESKNNTKFTEYLAIAKELYNEKVKQTINDKTKKKDNKDRKEFLLFIDQQTSQDVNKRQNKEPEVCIEEVLEKLDADEKDLVSFLLKKYKEWGATYVYLDQLQEEYGADSGWLFRVLRKLQTKRILYLYHDPKLGLRIGFTQSLKDKLNEC
ncbi:replication initiator protein WhiP [Sulfolobus acidocaldarius]|uniref:replication initiator protein WhiP n=1 Tax=Sulfolobus acidocaldarius TaxID=2285 RepID=UPI000AF6F06E|nr:replication initiator protein WhiP [Sulfolobus acidocaldarius]